MISPAQHILLEAIKASLFDVEPHYPSDVSWDEVVSEAKAQTVMGLISSSLPVQDESCEQIKAMYLRIVYEQDQVVKLLENANIPCVILKGCAAAIYYPKPYLRSMGDIDVLVPRGKFVEALKLLKLNGYVYDDSNGEEEPITEKTRELAFVKNGIIIEIHQRFSSPGVDVDDLLEAAIDNREFCNLNGYRFPILPSPENGLVLLGHINQHLKNSVLGLRQIIDWAMYIHSIAHNETLIKQFVSLAEKTNLLTLATYVTKLCNIYLGLLEKVEFGVVVDDDMSDDLMEVVLTDGNFGRRFLEGKTQDEIKIFRASYGIKRYGFFRYFTQAGFDTSSFCRKHSSLKFLAFIYGFFRQLNVGIKTWMKNKRVGKNMVEGRKIRELHDKRSELYKKLGVQTGSGRRFETINVKKDRHF